MAGTRFGRSQESGEAVAGVCALAGVATVVAAITNVFEVVSSVLSGVLAVLTGVSCLVANFSQEGLAFMWSFSPVRGMLGSPWPLWLPVSFWRAASFPLSRNGTLSTACILFQCTGCRETVEKYH